MQDESSLGGVNLLHVYMCKMNLPRSVRIAKQSSEPPYMYFRIHNARTFLTPYMSSDAIFDTAYVKNMQICMLSFKGCHTHV